MGEKIMYGKIILSEQICNITSIMNQNNKGAFNVVQGYTVSPDYMHLLIMKDPEISTRDKTGGSSAVSRVQPA